MARGGYRQIGQNGEWKSARALLGMGGHIYASCENGKLYVIDPRDGSYNQLGDSSGWKTRLMFGLQGTLCLIEESGSLWAVESSSGQYQKVGADGDWKNIDCGDWTRENIYCHSTQGTLWAYSTTNGGQWRQLGNSNGWKSKNIFAGRGLVTVEEDGTMYRVDTQSGDAHSFGKTQFKIIAGVGMRGHVYSHFSDGAIWDLDIESGSWSQVGDNKNWKTRFLVTTGDNLVSLEQNGTLYELYV